MNYIVKQRGTGKSTALVHASAVTGYRILTNNMHGVKYLQYIAEKSGFKIPTPMTMTEYLLKHRGLGDEGILIDDIEVSLPDILSAFFETDVKAVTMSTEHLR